jgi:hypothetical protein
MAILEHLAEYGDSAIRAQAVANPNMPELVLLNLLRYDPYSYRQILGWIDATGTEHPGNPVLPLLLLVNPTWFTQLTLYELLDITYHLDLPPRWRDLIRGSLHVVRRHQRR